MAICFCKLVGQAQHSKIVYLVIYNLNWKPVNVLCHKYSNDGHKWVCLNGHNIINRKLEFLILINEISRDMIGITESWKNTTVTYAELGLNRYRMFWKDGVRDSKL